MKVLLSSPNLPGVPSRYCLSVLDLDGRFFRWIDTSAFIDTRTDLGITGIAAIPDGVLLAIQSPSRPRIVRLSPHLVYQKAIEVPGLRDPHGLAVADGVVYVASTGTNEILAFDPDTGRHWRHWAFGERTDRDVLHLSSLAFHDGRLLATAHNHPLKEAFPSDCGCIIEPSGGGVLLSDLHRPHTLISSVGRLHFLNSAGGSIARLGPDGAIDREAVLGGFLRGVARVGDKLIVGSSSQRLHSRKLGVANANLALDEAWIGDRRFKSSIVVLDAETFVIWERIDFTLMAPEIFDVHPLVVEPDPRVLLDEAEMLRSCSMRHEIWALRTRVDRQREALAKTAQGDARRHVHERAVISFTGFDGGAISGEAYNPTRPGSAVYVRVIVDGQHVFYARSDLGRGQAVDVMAPRPRFSLQIPTGMLGQHRHRIELDVPDASQCAKVVLDLVRPLGAPGVGVNLSVMEASA